MARLVLAAYLALVASLASASRASPVHAPELDARARRSLLPVPSGDLALNDTLGWARLATASHQARFPSVAIHLATQRNQAFCSAATAATILNALGNAGVRAPVDAMYAPHAYFTQRSVFESACVRAVPTHLGDGTRVSAGFVAAHGATLDEWAAYLECFASVSHAHAQSDGSDASEPSGSVEAFRAALTRPDAIVGVNFHRPEIGELGGGHMSPVAAYDEATDTALVMDVSRYKYPPVWTPVSNLHAAMRAVDEASGLSRGWVVVAADANANANANGGDPSGGGSVVSGVDAAVAAACFASVADPDDWDAVMACARSGRRVSATDEVGGGEGGAQGSAGAAAATAAVSLFLGAGGVAGTWVIVERRREARFRRHVNLETAGFEDVY